MKYLYILIIAAIVIVWLTSKKENFDNPWSTIKRRLKKKFAADQAIADANVASIKAQQKAIMLREQCEIAARSNHATIDQARAMCA
jgi:hypothetical protein